MKTYTINQTRGKELVHKLSVDQDQLDRADLSLQDYMNNYCDQSEDLKTVITTTEEIIGESDIKGIRLTYAEGSRGNIDNEMLPYNKAFKMLKMWQETTQPGEKGYNKHYYEFIFSDEFLAEQENGEEYKDVALKLRLDVQEYHIDVLSEINKRFNIK